MFLSIYHKNKLMSIYTEEPSRMSRISGPFRTVHQNCALSYVQYFISTDCELDRVR